MTTNKLLAECHDLALRIAPELGDAPLYVLPATQLDWLGTRSSCLGFALTDAVDCNIVDKLGPAWRGAGPVVVLDIESLKLEPGDFRGNTLNTMVHEVAHITPAKKLRDLSDIATPQYKAWQRERLQQDFTSPTTELPGSPEDSHDWRFIRRALHLYVRAVAAGVDVPLRRLWASFHLCWPEHWLPIVLGEALAMRSLTFAEIEQAEPPAALTAMWQETLDKFNYFAERTKTQNV